MENTVNPILLEVIVFFKLNKFELFGSERKDKGSGLEIMTLGLSYLIIFC